MSPEEKPAEEPFTYISFGAGTQSTALLAMSALGLNGVKKADVAIFADTGDEPPSVYATLDFYKEWADEHGIEVVKVSNGHLSEDTLAPHNGARKRFAAIPAFTPRHGDHKTPTMLRRQCTREYKIVPIEREVKRRMGYKKGQRVNGRAVAMIGITTDEIARMKPARTRWVDATWPLIDAGMSRQDCIRFIKEAGLHAPSRSACVFCPFRHDEGWEEMRTERPAEFEEACRFDDAFRGTGHASLKQPVYLHRSLRPLRDVSFLDWKRPGQGRLFGGFNQECEGLCGV